MFLHSEQQLPTALNSYPDCPEFPENPDTLESPENRKPSEISLEGFLPEKNGGYLHPSVAIGGMAPLIRYGKTSSLSSEDPLRPRTHGRAGRL